MAHGGSVFCFVLNNLTPGYGNSLFVRCAAVDGTELYWPEGNGRHGRQFRTGDACGVHGAWVSCVRDANAGDSHRYFPTMHAVRQQIVPNLMAANICMYPLYVSIQNRDWSVKIQGNL